MKIRGYYFSQSSSGIQETYHESSTEQGSSTRPPYLVVCDAIVSNPDGAASTKASSAKAQMAKGIVEGTIREYLAEIPNGQISEEDLTIALEEAHRQLKQYLEQSTESTAVSAVIMATTPRGESGNEHDILVAGVGDLRVYQITPEKAKLLFFDPHNTGLIPDLNPQQRLNALKNAIGVQNHLYIHCRRIEHTQIQRHAILSYGVYEQTSEQEILQLGLKPHDKTNGATTVLGTKKIKGHELLACATAFGALPAQVKVEATTIQEISSTRTQAPIETSSVNTSANESPMREQRKRLTLGLTLASCTVLFLATLILARQAPATPEPTIAQARDPNPHTLIADASDTLTIDRKSDRALYMLERENAEMEDRIYTLTERLRNQSQEIALLESQLQNEGHLPATDVNTDPQVVQQMSDEISQNESTIRALQKDNENLRYELASSAARVENLEMSIEEIEQSKSDIEFSLTQEREEILARQHQAKETIEVELSELRDLLRKRESELAENEMKLTQSQQQVLSLEDELDMHNKALRSNEDQLADYAELLKQRDQLSGQAKTEKAKAEKFFQMLELAQKDLEKKEQEYEDRIQNLVNAVQNKDFEYQDEILAMNDAINHQSFQLQKATSQYEQLLENIHSLSDEKSSLIQENASLREEQQHMLAEQAMSTDTWKQRFEEEENRSRDYEEQIALLKRDLEQQSDSLATFQKSHSELIDRLDAAKEENLALLNMSREYEEQLASAKKLQNKLETEKLARTENEGLLREVTSSLSEQQGIISAFEQSQKRLVAELDMVKRDYSNLLHDMAKQTNTQTARTKKIDVINPIAQADMPDEARPLTRVHFVGKGETLTGISSRYYGTSRRWREIYEANKSTIADSNRIKVGTALVIP